MKSIEGRMRSSADPLPPEMWARAVQGSAELGVAAEASNPDVSYGDSVMTPRRVEAIRRVGQAYGESGQRLMRLVGIEPVEV